MKAELRTQGLKRRDAVERQERANFGFRLAALGPRLVRDVSAEMESPVVSLFHPIGSEPDPTLMALELSAAGTRLALPVDLSHGAPLVYRQWIPGDRLAVGPLRIAEPLEDAPEVEPDVLFIPVAAFDRRGHRIGYGAGNVDRTLAMLRRRKKVVAIGIAFSVQEETTIPNEDFDEAVDMVLTDRDLIVCLA